MAHPRPVRAGRVVQCILALPCGRIKRRDGAGGAIRTRGATATGTRIGRKIDDRSGLRLLPGRRRGAYSLWRIDCRACRVLSQGQTPGGRPSGMVAPGRLGAPPHLRSFSLCVCAIYSPSWRLSVLCCRRAVAPCTIAGAAVVRCSPRCVPVADPVATVAPHPVAARPVAARPAAIPAAREAVAPITSDGSERAGLAGPFALRLTTRLTTPGSKKCEIIFDNRRTRGGRAASMLVYRATDAHEGQDDAISTR